MPVRRPIHQLGQYYYNPVTGTMEGDRIHHLDTYQKDEPESAEVPPVVVNVNLAGILDGLGLGDLIKELLNRPRGVSERLVESIQTKVTRRQLLEAVVRGANPAEVADLMTILSQMGALD